MSTRANSRKNWFVRERNGQTNVTKIIRTFLRDSWKITLFVRRKVSYVFDTPVPQSHRSRTRWSMYRKQFLAPSYCGSTRCRVWLPTAWWVSAVQSWTTWVRTVRRSGNCWIAVYRARPPRSCVKTPCPVRIIKHTRSYRPLDRW